MSEQPHESLTLGPWVPAHKVHSRYPLPFRQAARTLLLMRNRAGFGLYSCDPLIVIKILEQLDRSSCFFRMPLEGEGEDHIWITGAQS